MFVSFAGRERAEQLCTFFNCTHTHTHTPPVNAVLSLICNRYLSVVVLLVRLLHNGSCGNVAPMFLHRNRIRRYMYELSLLDEEVNETREHLTTCMFEIYSTETIST